mgnify:CR=1 FL=1
MGVSTHFLINTRSLVEWEDGTTKQLVAQENSRLGTKYTARKQVVLHNVLILVVYTWNQSYLYKLFEVSKYFSPTRTIVTSRMITLQLMSHPTKLMIVISIEFIPALLMTKEGSNEEREYDDVDFEKNYSRFHQVPTQKLQYRIYMCYWLCS